ncbi:60S ribosomal protein L6 [Orobanche hederae]
MISTLPKRSRRRKRRVKMPSLEQRRLEKNALPEEKKEDQKAVDAPLLRAVEVVPDLKAYLGARFSLMAGMKPHQLVF